jgi:hypothetical protein
MIMAPRRKGSRRSRSGAGAVTKIALIWLIARVRLSVAESLAHFRSRIISTFSPPDFGITVSVPEIQVMAVGLRINGVVLAQSATPGSIRAIDLHDGEASVNKFAADPCSEGGGAFRGEQGGCAEGLIPADQLVIPLAGGVNLICV